MTEALYRGKRTDNGEWIEGWYVSDLLHDIAWIVRANQTGENNPEFYYAEVVPETVGQYVRNDVKGRPAFEGDIIKNDLGDEVGVIRFGEYRNTMNDDGFGGHVGFYVEWHGGKKAEMLRKDVGYWLKYHPVAGNIHDNPELLEVKE